MRTMPRTLTIAEAILPGHGILRDALIGLGFHREIQELDDANTR